MGAFNNLTPITMFSLKYDCNFSIYPLGKEFSMGMGDVPQGYHGLFMFCLKPTLHVTHKVIYPKSGETP